MFATLLHGIKAMVVGLTTLAASLFSSHAVATSQNLLTGTGSTTAQATPAAVTYDETSNWSGYTATSGTFTAVNGTWTVPKASGNSSETSADATWIGIGGVSSTDLIQVGTQDVVSPSGQVSSSAFYELLPDSSEAITSLNVNPGDVMTASITETSSDEWAVRIKDDTTDQSYGTTLAYDSTESSAEWIEEDPSSGSNELPLDNFGTITFSAASADRNGSTASIKNAGGSAVTMVSSDGQTLASTSALTSTGKGFSVTRTDASSGPSISQYNIDPGSWRWHGVGIGRMPRDYISSSTGSDTGSATVSGSSTSSWSSPSPQPIVEFSY